MPDRPQNPPRFVLSYARRERDSFLERFFADVRREIAFKEGLDPDPQNVEPGFRDTDAIPSGADWPQALATALAHGWGLLSLYTPNYFKRDACGKEFQVFLERAGVTYDAAGAANGARGILPILWASMDDLKRNGFPPAVTQRINFNAGKHQERYEREGLRHILKRSPRTAYVDILDDIVRDLVDAFAHKPPPLPTLPDFKAMKNAFAALAPVPADEATGPTSLMMFLLSEPGAAGAFTEAGAKSWIEELQDRDPRLHVEVSELDLLITDTATLNAKLEEQSKLNRLVFVAVDPAATNHAIAELLALLQGCVDSPAWTGAIVLAQHDGSGQALADQIRVPPESVDRLRVTCVGGAEDFADALCGLILDVWQRVVKQSEVQQRAPGGGKPAEQPRIHGPVEKPHGE